MNSTLTPEPFGHWLKAQREDRNMTLKDCERYGDGCIIATQLAKIETGEITILGLDFIASISAVLCLSANEAFERARADGAIPPAPQRCPACGRVLKPDACDALEAVSGRLA